MPKTGDTRQFSLEHTITVDDVVRPRAWRYVLVLAGCCLVGSFAAFGVFAEFSGPIAVVILVGTLLGWLRSSIQYRRFKKRLPRIVRISDKTITVVTPLGHRDTDLKRCWWFIGDAQQDDNGELLPRSESVVFVFPNDKTVCGKLGEIGEWKECLEKFGVPHLSDLNSRRERVFSRRLAIRSAVIGVPIGGIVGMLIGITVRTPLVQTTVAHSIAAGLCGLCQGLVYARLQRRPTLPADIPCRLVGSFGILGWYATLGSQIGGPPSFIGMAAYMAIGGFVAWMTYLLRPSPDTN